MAANPEIKNEDLLAVRSYVTANDPYQYNHLHPSTLLLDLTHSNLVQQHIEIRFDAHDTLWDLRHVIHRKTGTPPCFQHLQIQAHGHVIGEIAPDMPDTLQLGYFSLQHGMTIHCMDLDPYSGSKGGLYEDTSLVQKYSMSETDYDARKGTLRDWERNKKLQDPHFTLAKHAKEHAAWVEARRQGKLGLELPRGFEYDECGEVVRIIEQSPSKVENEMTNANDDAPGTESVQGIQLNMRCQVQPGGRRGRVAFVGEVPELTGWWVGIIFDEPVGKTNGCTPQGIRYFDALAGYGGFVRGKNCHVGDYPERDIMDDDSDDEL